MTNTRTPRGSWRFRGVCVTASLAGLAAACLPFAARATATEAAACAVTFTDANDWGSGFTARVTLTDTGTTTLSNWTLAYGNTGDQKLVDGWNGTWSQTGNKVTVTAPGYQTSIAPGASYTIGANFAYSGVNSAPTGFTVNGIACDGGDSPSPTPTPPPTPTPTPTDRPGRVTRDGTHLRLDGQNFRFSGANIYWLGLDENVGGIAYPTRFRVDDALETAKAMGVTVIRSHTLGISTGTAASLEPSLDHFNDAAFDSIDYAVARAGQLGFHLVVPLTDNWHWYHGGRHDFTDWLGLPEDAFYTDSRAVSAFERYIDHLLDHVNPYTGLAYKNDPTVLAFELGNELTGMNAGWVQTIASHLKKISPDHLVAAPWDSADYSASDVDVVDAHYYPPSASAVTRDAADITGHGKVYLAGEYGWTSADSALYDTFASDQDVTGALFWSLFPHADDHGYVQHNDGFTLHFPGDDAAMKQAAASIRALDYRMSGRAEPPVPAPGRPAVTSARRSSGQVVLAWRGATTAGSYSVLRSTAGTGGPWQTVCDRCATDNTTPWTDTSAPSGPVWYAVAPYTADGTAGPRSDPARVD